VDNPNHILIFSTTARPINKQITTRSYLGIIPILFLAISLAVANNFFLNSYAQNKQEQVNLTGLFVEPADRWKDLIPSALQELRTRHPNLDIEVNYTIYPYNDARTQILKSMSNVPVDLISLDQIWLGEFANKSYIVDLTDRIDPNSLKTWDGYIESAKKLDAALEQRGIHGIELVGGPGSQNEWYPFLWMTGGDILQYKPGHPTKGSYWFPTYNSTEGVRALEFFRQLVSANVKPITVDFEKEFAAKNYTVMLGGSWLPGNFVPLTKQNFEQKIGMIPMFPVPNEGTRTSSIMGGWLLSIPQTSKHKELAWELITIMLKPEILSPVLAKYGYLPTQVSIGEGPYSAVLRNSIPYYDQLISMITFGHSRPNIPEYPQIADQIRQAIDEVYAGSKTPKEALDDAAEKSAKTLGW
jgi:multiple sugar transport system substrate-binding protein